MKELEAPLEVLFVLPAGFWQERTRNKMSRACWDCVVQVYIEIRYQYVFHPSLTFT